MFKCEKCGKEFNTQRGLNKHRCGDACLCPVCSKTFNSNVAVSMHMKAHNEDYVRFRSEATSIQLNNQWKDEEYREKQIEKLKEANINAWNSDDGSRRKRVSEKLKELRSYSDEEWKEKLKQFTEWEFLGSERCEGNTYLNLKHTCGDVLRKQVSHVYSYGIRCERCDPYGSKEELKVLEYVKSICPDAIKLIRGKYDYELDVFIPSRNIAFEYNGLFWHSSGVGMKRSYHANKTNYFLSKGIKVYYLWSNSSDTLNFALIDAVLGNNKRIFARNTVCKKVDWKDKQKFFRDNHLHGDSQSTINYGLYLDNKLVSCISIVIRNNVAEIARYSTIIGYTVVGGFSKLMVRVKEELNKLGVRKIITYSYKDKTPDYRDTVYYKYGFTYLGDSGPILRYLENNSVVSRQKYQKHKLYTLFSDYNGENVEEFLREKKIYQIYDSGNHKFELML